LRLAVHIIFSILGSEAEILKIKIVEKNSKNFFVFWLSRVLKKILKFLKNMGYPIISKQSDYF
jgi:hypothetical protein